MRIKESMIRRYNPKEAAVFRIVKKRFGGLSNFGAFPLEVNGVAIATSEALYQACRFPTEPDLQRMVIAQPNPMAAKLKAHEFVNRTRGDWFLRNANVYIMRWILRVKLACNWESFGDLLESTGEMPIVEHSKHDVYWGARMQGDELVGVNALGRLLMELRELLRGVHRDDLTRVEPLNIPDFRLYGKPIGVVADLPEAETAERGQNG